MKALPEHFGELRYQVKQAAAKGFELTMSADGLLLLDDLTESASAELIDEGFECVLIETSEKNYQALLATAQGWKKEQVKQTQTFLSQKFGTDGNSTAAEKHHRLPGSLNRKNDGVFVTRLVKVQAGRLVEPQVAAFTKSNSSRPQLHRSSVGKDITGSGMDFGRACELLARGLDRGAVQAEIEGRAADRNRHGDHLEYAKRTVQAALTRLAF